MFSNNDDYLIYLKNFSNQTKGSLCLQISMSREKMYIGRSLRKGTYLKTHAMNEEEIKHARTFYLNVKRLLILR